MTTRSAADIALGVHREAAAQREAERRDREATERDRQAAQRREAEAAALIRRQASVLNDWFPDDVEWRYVETWVGRASGGASTSQKWDIWESGEPGSGSLVRVMVSDDRVLLAHRHNSSRTSHSRRWEGLPVRDVAEIGAHLQREIDEFNRAAASGEMDR